MFEFVSQLRQRIADRNPSLYQLRCPHQPWSLKKGSLGGRTPEPQSLTWGVEASSCGAPELKGCAASCRNWTDFTCKHRRPYFRSNRVIWTEQMIILKLFFSHLTVTLTPTRTWDLFWVQVRRTLSFMRRGSVRTVVTEQKQLKTYCCLSFINLLLFFLFSAPSLHLPAYI